VAKKAEQVLGMADITVNKKIWFLLMIKSAFVTSGIRVGVPAITTRGMKEKDMQFIVNAIDDTLMHAEDANHIAGIKKQVNEYMHQFELYPEMK